MTWIMEHGILISSVCAMVSVLSAGIALVLHEQKNKRFFVAPSMSYSVWQQNEMRGWLSRQAEANKTAKREAVIGILEDDPELMEKILEEAERIAHEHAPKDIEL